MKWIGRFVFIIIIMFAALYILQLGYISRNNKYYTEEIKNSWNNTDEFLQGVSTLQYLDYYQEDPIYFEQFDGDTASFDLYVFAIGATYEDEFYDGFMIFINNVVIYDDEGALVQNPMLRLKVTLSDYTILIDDEYVKEGAVVFDPTADTFYGNTPALLLFDIDGNMLNASDSENVIQSELSKLTIDYSDGTTDDDGNYIFSTDETNGEALFIGSYGTITESALFTDENFEVKPEDYQLSTQFGDDGFTDDDVTTFGLNTTQGDLASYNSEIYRTMIIYGLIVITLTYFLFFHKTVMEKIRDKKAAKADDSVELQVEPIFKDAPQEDKEDGK